MTFSRDSVTARRLAGALILALAIALGWLLLLPRSYETGLGARVNPAELEPLGALPAIAITALDGTTYSNATLAGKVAVLHFWGTNCAPCVGEIPALRAAWPTELEPLPEFAFVALASDRNVRTLERFITSRGILWPVAASQEPATTAVWGNLGIESTPTTVIVDPTGQIRWVGTKIPENLPEIVKALANA